MNLRYHKVSIIGGTGKMGSWFSGLLGDLGLEVAVYGKSSILEPVDMVKDRDVVVISVPIRKTVEVIKEIGPTLPEDALLMDLTSIKTDAMEAMLKYSKASVVGLHPLFGPNPGKEPLPLKVAVCPGRGEAALDWAVEIIKIAGLTPLIVGSELHDHLMGIIQGVQHFTMMALGLFIQQSNFRLEHLIEYAPPSFAQALKRIQKLLQQPPELFGPLMMDNPFSHEFIHSYVKLSERLCGIVNNKDMDSFHELFLSLKEYFTGEETRHETGMGQGGSMEQGIGHGRA